MKYKDYCLLLGAEQNRDRALLGAARATSAPVALMLANGAVNAHRFADVLLQGDPTSVDSALRAVERYRQRTGALPCYIVPLSEVTVATGLAIAQQFGLKYLTADAVRWARNKNLMKQQFAAHALPLPRHALVETAADLDSVARQIGFPLVIKPTNGGGSMGVQMARNPRELENAFQQLEETARQMQLHYGLPRLPFQVEEYIEAPYEVSVEVLNTPQNRVVFAVTDKFLGALPYFVELGHSVPSRWSRNEQITLTALKACKALGIHRGVAHVEMKIRASGEPVLIEVNARPGGDNIMDLVERVTGLNLFEFHVRSYLDDSGFNRDVALSGRASIAFLKAPPGRILEVRLPAIDELPPEVVALNIWSREGAVSGPCIDSDSRDGAVELFWADADGVAADAHMDIARRLSEECFTVQRETTKLTPLEYSCSNAWRGLRVVGANCNRPDRYPAERGNGMTQKHALVVGAISNPHEYLAKLGYRISWFWRRSPKKMPGMEDNNRCQHIFIHDPGLDDEALVEHAVIINRYDPIDVVVAFHDSSQLLAMNIAEKLGLPHFYSRDALLLTINKHRMREKLAKTGLNTVRHAVLASAAELGDFYARHQDIDRVIIKPLAGTGSENVFSLYRHEQARLAEICQRLNMAFPILIEEFIEGQEFSVEGVSYAGRHHIVAVTEKFKHPGTYMESGHLVPGRLENGVREKLEQYVRQCLDVLGIQYGLSHTEVIVRDGEPVIVETHTRGGGDRISDLVKFATGIDLYDISAQLGVGLELDEQRLVPTANGKYACVRFLVQDGVEKPIKRIAGIEEIKNWPDVTDVTLTYQVGDILPAVKNSFDRAASVLVVADSADRALDMSEKAINAIQIECA